MIRTAFFGTPALAVPALRALAETTEVVGVVCQPDRPAGRGLELRAPAVKQAALDLGLDVHQPVKVKTGTLDRWLRERATDAAVVLAYGRILPKPVLDAPTRGCINLHASLLPKYRGAAPIQWAIIEGETETGISLMQMDEGMDTGPVFTMRRIAIATDDDAGSLGVKLAELAATVVREDLPRALSGELTAVPQNAEAATSAPPIGASDTVVDWSRPADAICHLVRGLAPRPGARTQVGKKSLRILGARPAPTPPHRLSGDDAAAGTILVADKRGIYVKAGSDDLAVEVLRAQLEGKKALDARDLVNGRTVQEGDRLG